MIPTERRALLLAGLLVAIVFAFLGGFLVSNCQWFESPKDALFGFIRSIGSNARRLVGMD